MCDITKIDLRQLGRSLIAAVAKRLCEQGFRANVGEQIFSKSIPGGKVVLHLAFIRHSDDFDVTADVALRLDEVEMLTAATLQAIGAAAPKGAYTLGAELGNLAGTGQMRWTVRPGDNVESVGREIIAAFERIGAPFLEAASTMEGAFGLLCRPGREARTYSPINLKRAARIAVLSSLLGQQDRARPIIDEHRRLIRQVDPTDAEPFDRFLTQLGNRAT